MKVSSLCVQQVPVGFGAGDRPGLLHREGEIFFTPLFSTGAGWLRGGGGGEPGGSRASPLDAAGYEPRAMVD